MRRFLATYVQSKTQTGFTLIELITVIVVMAVLAALGSGFVVSAINGFHQTQERSKLINRGRAAIEQMSRQLREALPNSVRVSGNFQCIEYIPVVNAGFYISPVPDAENGAAASATIESSPFSTVGKMVSDRAYVSVAPLASNELYGGSPASLVGFASLNTSSIPYVINLSSAKQWVRNSPSQRVYIASYPRQFCVSGSDLTRHLNYTSGTFPADADLSNTPPNAGQLMANNVSLVAEQVFTVSNGTEDRNTVVTINLPLSNAVGERLVLTHQVMVRGVP